MASEKVMGDDIPTKGLRRFRATVADGDSTIVFEFHAPWPIDPDLDYQQWAIHALLHALNANKIIIRDIEPVEIP
jgi:hypothetical protein|tara:strand:- start:300 stop:524 length:225 start_codon:yes stop_codon:yes gene_type:complete